MNRPAESTWDSVLYNEAKKLITELFMMLKTASLYDVNNNAFINTFTGFAGDLNRFVEKLGSLTLEIIEGSIYLNQEKIKSDLYTDTAFHFIIEDIKSKKIGGIVVETIPETEALKNFILIFSRYRPLPSDAATHETINQELKQRNIDTIHVLPFKERSLAATVDEQTVATNKASALRNYVRAMEVMKEAIHGLKEKRGFDARAAKQVVYNLVKHSFDEGYAFVSLSTIKNYDLYTFNHCVNVCIIAITFGQNLGLNKRQLADLGIGALYHDIGKVDIPKTLLNKAGQFSDDEWRIMKQHPIMAIRHLLPLKGATDLDIKKVVPAFEHHRDFDLSGYPPLTIRKPLNFYTKVIAIADTYDAMTSGRTYQKGLLPTEALQYITKVAGKKFDPVLVKAFVNTMGIYPVGSAVELNTGHIAIVSKISRNPEKFERPEIIAVRNKQGAEIKPQTIDLESPAHDNIQITKAVSAKDYNINVAHYLLSS